jgi:PadR family transcriptional regulator PadR
MSDLEKEEQQKLVKCLLDYIILQLLNAKQKHGYELIADIKKTFNIYFGPSTIYPLLATLEKKGYISNHWDTENDRPRKIYTLTPTGHNILDFTKSALNTIIQKLSRLTDETP